MVIYVNGSIQNCIRAAQINEFTVHDILTFVLFMAARKTLLYISFVFSTEAAS